MKVNLIQLAVLALAFSFFTSQSVQAATFDIDDYCKYIDLNEVTIRDGLYHFKTFVHTHHANDVADSYSATLPVGTSETFVNNDCVTVQFHGKSSGAEYYARYPLTPGPADDYNHVRSMPQNSYLYVPITSVNSTDVEFIDTQEEVILQSAMNVEGKHADKGIVIITAPNGGYHFILRQLVFGSAVSAVNIDNSVGCPASGEKIYRNCAVVHGPLKDGQTYHIGKPFFSTFKINFVLWIMVCFTLTYFIWALGTSTNDPLLPHYIGSTWFNYSFYSVWVFGNPRQTKTSRLTLILIDIGAILIAVAFLHWIYRKEKIVDRVAISAAVGVGFGLIIQRIGAFFLNGLTRAHHRFLDNIKNCTTHDQREDCLDHYDNSRLTWNYLFYVYALLVWMGACWGAIGILINFDNAKFWWFMLSFGIALAFEFIIVDLLCVLLGKGNSGFARFVQSRGYYIDFPLHEKFDKYLAELD